MNLSGRESVNAKNVNVVPLFGKITQEVELNDPLSDLLLEAEVEETILTAREVKPRKIVSESQFPDQSVFTLSEQLRSLKSSLGRMSFYLEEIEDILPATSRY